MNRWLFFFSLLYQSVDDEALTRLLQTSLFLHGRFTNPGEVDVFLPQIFPDITHPDLHLTPSASLSLHVSMQCRDLKSKLIVEIWLN